MYKLLALLASNNYTIRTFLYNLLINNYKKKETRLWRHGWNRIILNNSEQPVNTTVHGYKALVNCGCPYPLVSRLHPQFNSPLLQLTYQTYSIKKKELFLVDIGASVGDTVFLLVSNLPDIFKSILCIDGHDEFFNYLHQNMQQFSFVKCIQAVLSDKTQLEKNLVRIHSGSASVVGPDYVHATSFDELIMQNENENIDVLKIDADGFDGKILAGACEALSKHKPQVIFEWHPSLIAKTGNDFRQHFIVLEDCGYQKFLFFNKYGDFSHFMQGVDIWELEQLCELCLNNIAYNDWHYDVIALPDELINIIELAECAFSKNKKNAY